MGARDGTVQSTPQAEKPGLRRKTTGGGTHLLLGPFCPVSVNRCGPKADTSRDITHTGSGAEAPKSILFKYLFLGVLIFILEKLENQKRNDA